MNRSPLRFAMLLAATLAAWQPSKARADDEDTQLWHFVLATGDLDKDTSLTLDATQRWRSEARGGDQQTIRFNIDQTVANGVRIGGGAALFEAGGNTEIRPHQQVTVMLGRVELRTRLEERFFDRADRAELRLRQRIQYNQPLGDGWRANIGGEWLGLVQGRNRGEGASTEQWRAQVRLGYAVNTRLEIGAGYWLLAHPRGDRQARYTHVPQTVLTWRF